MARIAAMSASTAGRAITSAGRSEGQHGGADKVPMTTSAACGSPVQHAGLTETMLEVPTLSTTTKPTFLSTWQWCEQVDWEIPRSSARSPIRIEPDREVERVWSNRTRVGSASSANHSANCSALARSRLSASEPEIFMVEEYLASIDQIGSESCRERVWQ